jgi:hypothetical protein
MAVFLSNGAVKKLLAVLDLIKKLKIMLSEWITLWSGTKSEEKLESSSIYQTLLRVSRE